MSLPKNLTISIRNLQNKILVFPEKLRRSVVKILKEEKARVTGELTISFVSDSEIRRLNAKYLKKNSTTDVLSFNAGGSHNKKIFFADIVISVDTAIRNAKLFKTSPEYEINLYAVHGLLHLLGYNDNTENKRKAMQKKELKYANTQN